MVNLSTPSPSFYIHTHTFTQDQAYEATIQCIRCLYDIDLSPNATALDHRSSGRRPEGLEENMTLANFVLRYLEEGEDAPRKKQMLTALQLAYEVGACLVE